MSMLRFKEGWYVYGYGVCSYLASEWRRKLREGGGGREGTPIPLLDARAQNIPGKKLQVTLLTITLQAPESLD